MSMFNHFSSFERRTIQKYLRKKKSLRQIARILERSVSSISDEIRHNSVNGKYIAEKADHKAYVKRKYSKVQCMKVAEDLELQKFVIENLKEDQSPEGISGRLKKVERNIQYASAKAIYKFVGSPNGRHVEKYLYSNAVSKKSGPKRGKPVLIDGRVMIDKRPKKVEKRAEFGHFEGDFIESGKDGKGSLLMLVERKTRYPFLAYLEDRSTASVNRIARRLLVGIPIKSLTIDNDISFQKHEELSRMIHAEIFFCHPQSPHEKGTVENRNKAVRRYIPKRTDLSKIPKEIFAFVETRLRDKFMECLGYRTPQECFEKEMKKVGMKKTAQGGMMETNILPASSVRIQG